MIWVFGRAALRETSWFLFIFCATFVEPKYAMDNHPLFSLAQSPWSFLNAPFAGWPLGIPSESKSSAHLRTLGWQLTPGDVHRQHQLLQSNPCLPAHAIYPKRLFFTIPRLSNDDYAAFILPIL